MQNRQRIGGKHCGNTCRSIVANVQIKFTLEKKHGEIHTSPITLIIRMVQRIKSKYRES
jgi:hypothetical protein